MKTTPARFISRFNIRNQMAKIKQVLKVLIITLSVFFTGYILDSLRPQIVGNYFEISTKLLPLVLAFSIFIMTWYSYRRSMDNHSLFLGAVFFIIGLFTLFHVLSYPFMPDFITPNSQQKASIFWIEAVLISALLFPASAYIYKKTLPGIINMPALFASALVLSSIVLIITLLYVDRLPQVFDPGGGTTGIFLLLVTTGFILGGCYLYAKRIQKTGQNNLICLIYGFIILLSSYSVHFFFEYPEHLLKATGFYFVYIALYKSSIDQPYENLVLSDEKRRQEFEEKYSGLFGNAHDAIITTDLDDMIISWNQSAEKMFGWKDSEAIGKSLSELIIPPGLHDKRREVIRNAISGLAVIGVDTVNLRKDGTEINVSVKISPLRDSDRNTIALSSIIRDINEYKLAEEELSWQVEVNAAMVELSSTLLSPATVEDISALVLEHAKTLTSSLYGYVGYIDPNTGHLVCPTMTRDMMEICKVKGKNNVLKEFRGLFGWVITSEKSILTNDPKNDPRSSGTPPGHIAIHRFLSAPAMLKKDLVGQLSVPSPVGSKIHIMRYYDRGKLVGQVALANSGRDYTDRDLAVVERLADLYAIAINRYWAEEQIKENLKEKEILLKEIHHRVKNNMQIISSLLRLQSRQITDIKYTDMLRESQNRIVSMSLIHEKLYHSKGLSKIDFNDYIRDLVNGLFQSFGVNGSISLKLEIRDVSLGIDSAVPCGLIINELVMNSLKHAFPEGRKGEIGISLHPVDENMYELVVRDDGVSIPENVDITKTESLGLHLVSIMVESQLHGEISLYRNKGTEFRIKFKDVK